MAEENKNNAQDFSIELLKIYYARLFPYDSIFNWLSYGNDPNIDKNYIDKDFFSHREWSFTIDDIYIRYQSFYNKNEMIEKIQKVQPYKIDIGAVFTACPKDHMTINPDKFKTVERELVFDIDMTDYDEIRTCCSGANICSKCWPFMTVALKVVDRSLREDFGFKHILWVYSGRRGIHCWVCDPSARELSNEARSAVVDYLSVQTGSDENSDKNLSSTFKSIHPMIKKSYDIMEPYFSKYIASEKGQGVLVKKNLYIRILNTLPNEQIRVDLNEIFNNSPSMSGSDRWEKIKLLTTPPSIGDKHDNKRKKVNYAKLESWRYELVFKYCYARLDANVSKTQNHLLKSPFSVHPKTGRVCIPIDPREADSFDPFSVPTIKTLCDEIDSFKEEKGDAMPIVSDIEKSSMKYAVATFNNTFLNDLEKTNR